MFDWLKKLFSKEIAEIKIEPAVKRKPTVKKATTRPAKKVVAKKVDKNVKSPKKTKA